MNTKQRLAGLLWYCYCAFILWLVVGLCGCLTQKNIVSAIRELKGDSATVEIQVLTPYGQAKIVRTNPGTNTPPYTISPDGNVVVKP